MYIMRRFMLLCLLAFMASGVVQAQQMSDEQVILYVQEGQKLGKSQQQMLTELMKKGVTKEQILRIQSKYSNGSSSTTGGDDTTIMDQVSTRMRTQKTYENKNKNISGQDENALGSDLSGRVTIRSLRQKSKQKSSSGNSGNSNGLTFGTDSISDFYGLDTGLYTGLQVEEEIDPTQQIFGHNIFDNENLTFEPNINVATPMNYRLGAGDEVIIDVWGASQTTIRETISPEGTVQIENLGPVYLGGKTVKEANDYLKREFTKIYAGVSGEAPNTQIQLTLGEIRSIQVNVMGEVVVPGTYTLSSFATVFHALYWAGGVNKIGSLRSVCVVRDGKTVADVDIYDFIMEGRLKEDISLQDGDVVLVNPYRSLVQILGKVKRPMFYEMKPTETIATLLGYAGGFTGDAYKKAIRLVRKSGRELQIYNVDEMDYSVFKVEDGDVLTVDSVLDRYENRVEVRGAVYREGLYQLSGEVNTVKQLIKKAEGLRGDAFMNRAVLNREYDDLSREVIAIDLKGLMQGTVADIPLMKNDILLIPSIQDLKEEATVTIHGEVATPGTYLYADKMTIEDLVLQSGGLLETASETRVDVSRRIKSPRSTEDNNAVGQTYTFDLKDGLLLGEGSENFYLEPFDEVYIRKSPAYRQQKNVGILGEALFTGTYALTKKNERLSDLVAKAGGVTSDAYVRGARIIRTMSEDEVRRKEDAVRIAVKAGVDSTTLYVYTVGIHLDEALKNPGSDYDMVLREGDVLYIPEFVSTVKVSGAVMYPNTVLYKEGEKSRFYINQAGGFASDAKKRKAFVVYMNGTMSRISSGSKGVIEPGCEIIVPSKDASRRMSTAEMVSMGTSVATLGTMIATLVNLFK